MSAFDEPIGYLPVDIPARKPAKLTRFGDIAGKVIAVYVILLVLALVTLAVAGLAHLVGVL